MFRLTIAAVAGAASLALVAAVPASAHTAGRTGGVDVGYHCVEDPYGEADAVFVVTLTAPDRVHLGDTLTVDATVTTTTPAPEGLEPHTLVGEIEVIAGGSGTGTVEATGLTNPVVPPAGDPLTLSGGQASYVADAAGKWTFRPGVFETINANNEHLVCTPLDTTPVLARTHVG